MAELEPVIEPDTEIDMTALAYDVAGNGTPCLLFDRSLDAIVASALVMAQP